MLSQLSLIVQLYQLKDKRLTRVEMDVVAMKQLMALGDDDTNDMVVDNTPPNSPCDNPPLLRPPSTNVPSLSHPLHNNPSPPSSSPP